MKVICVDKAFLFDKAASRIGPVLDWSTKTKKNRKVREFETLHLP